MRMHFFAKLGERTPPRLEWTTTTACIGAAPRGFVYRNGDDRRLQMALATLSRASQCASALATAQKPTDRARLLSQAATQFPKLRFVDDTVGGGGKVVSPFLPSLFLFRGRSALAIPPFSDRLSAAAGKRPRKLCLSTGFVCTLLTPTTYRNVFRGFGP